MASKSLSAREKGKVDENQFTGRDDIFVYLRSTPNSIMYDADDDELEINSKEEARVNISILRSETQADNRGEKDADNRGEKYTAIASQKLKFDLFVHHFMKIKNDTNTVVSVSCKNYSKPYKWSSSGVYRTFRKHLKRVHPYKANLIKTLN